MASTNLVSFISAYDGLSLPVFSKYCRTLGIDVSLGGDTKGMRPYELESLKVFIDIVKRVAPKQYTNLLNNCNIGFTIPQIGKEFDLLWISDDAIINVELKSADTGEKIRKQLIKNHYYLSYSSKPVYLFTFVSETKEVYFYNESSESIERGQVKTICDLLNSSKPYETSNLSQLFKPTDYLVSPFNDTEKFLEGHYFLSNQQEEIKKNIIEFSISGDETYKAITGDAGTGKSLLVYDIAKSLINSRVSVLIIHCGVINKGQELLNSNGWSIINPKLANESFLTNYDFIIIDEAQRLYASQRDNICSCICKQNKKCIFSFDPAQWLHSSEVNRHNDAFINELIKPQKPYRLSGKIRTNINVDSFISCLFNKNLPIKEIAKDFIHISYSSSEEVTRNILIQLFEDGWKVPRYTPGIRTTYPYEKLFAFEEISAHEVIGQEYDKVVAVIDSDFTYSDKGFLTTEGRDIYYSKSKMLYQILTRARKEVHIVVYNNPHIFERCLQIICNY